MLDAFMREWPAKPWVHFQLALCYEGVGDAARASKQLQRYLKLHGSKYAVETITHLAQLRQAQRASLMTPMHGNHPHSFWQAMFRDHKKTAAP